MDASPAQKLAFKPVQTNGVENAIPLVGLPELARPALNAVAEAENSIAITLRPDEVDEPLLRVNPNRFVLFPIKYHEVCPPYMSSQHVRSSSYISAYTAFLLDMADVQEGRGILLDC